MSVQSDALRLAPNTPSMRGLVRDDTQEVVALVGRWGHYLPCRLRAHRLLGHSR